MKNKFIARTLCKEACPSAKPAQLPSLVQLSIQAVAANYELYPSLTGLANTTFIDKIMKEIDISKVNMVVLAKNVDHEEFWKRACGEAHSFSDNNMSEARKKEGPSVSFKQKFFELLLPKLIAGKKTSPDFFKDIALSAGPFIKSYNVEEVSEGVSHLALEALQYLTNLEQLAISFLCSSREAELGLDSGRGLNLERCSLIQKNGRFDHLRVLKLENNNLRPEGLRLILKVAKTAKQLKHLSIAHNRISNEGA